MKYLDTKKNSPYNILLTFEYLPQNYYNVIIKFNFKIKNWNFVTKCSGLMMFSQNYFQIIHDKVNILVNNNVYHTSTF